ncbi:MAG: hypothetical protein H7Y15_17310 [Pseudonocardia sp.]|nr:hypothetical protein [Pseudonocardia sp.]
MSDPRSPKDTFITVYGRKPVLEALDDVDLRVDKVIVAEGLRGDPVRAILDAGGESLLDATLPARVALVLGNETDGLSETVRPLLDGVLGITMHNGVESLGVAGAGAVVSFELARRAR